jgi:hypothetical protein
MTVVDAVDLNVTHAETHANRECQITDQLIIGW